MPVVVLTLGVGYLAMAQEKFVSGTEQPAPVHATAAEARFLAENDAAMTTMMNGMTIKPTGNADRDFVAMMVPHHQGAIDMAESELRYGHNGQLLRIAQEIIVEQLQEIAAMRITVGDKLSSYEATLAAAVPGPSAEAPPALSPQSAAGTGSSAAEAPFLAENNTAMTKMMNDMTVKPTGSVDRDFVGMMIPHHQGAIDMAQAELRYGHDGELRHIAQEIIVDQLQEIALMRFAVGEALPPSIASPTDPSPDPLPQPQAAPQSSPRTRSQASPADRT
jgi:uncharacterized protein (DUF305 family)